MSTIYAVIYTDLGDTTDHLARLEGAYTNREDAEKAMQSDIAYYLNVNDCYKLTEADSRHTLVGDEEGGCLWQIIMIPEVK
jgi:hypothetical protein